MQVLFEQHGMEALHLPPSKAEEAADVLLDLVRVGTHRCQEAAASTLRYVRLDDRVINDGVQRQYVACAAVAPLAIGPMVSGTDQWVLLLWENAG